MASIDKTENILEMPGFRNLIHFAFPNYKMPDSSTFHNEIIPRVVKQMQDQDLPSSEYKRKFHHNNPYAYNQLTSLDVSGVSPER